MSDQTSDTLARLTALADAATEGPWHATGNAVRGPDRRETCLALGYGDNRHADAEFIAAADPDTVRALVGELIDLRDGITALCERGEADGRGNAFELSQRLRALLAGEPE